MKVLLLESDRIISACIAEELAKRNIQVVAATNADAAITAADTHLPDLIICELSLHSHSGTEFLYEFRTYSDWQSIPIVVFSSIQVPANILKSKDWRLLDIAQTLYKPNNSLQRLADTVESLISL